MKSSKLIKLLQHAFPRGRRVLIKGAPGLGKSDAVAQAVAGCIWSKDSQPFDLIICHPAVSDPTDYKGMPAVANDGTHAEFLPFGDLNRMIEAKRPTVVFLDDLGQAPAAVQAALMQLILARRVNGHKISDFVVFCAATNDTTHMAGVSGLLEPVKSRFDTIVELNFDLDDWCNWLSANNYPVEGIAFARFRPAIINAWADPKFKPTREIKNVASPRTCAAMFRWFAEGEKDFDVLSGAAGEGVATEFLGFVKMYAGLPSLDAILLDPVNSPLPDNPAACYAVITGLARKSTPQNFERVLRYLSRMEKEYEMCAVRDVVAIGGGKDKNGKPLPHPCVNTPAFINWSTKNNEYLS